MNIEGFEIEEDEHCDQAKWIALLDAKVARLSAEIETIKNEKEIQKGINEALLNKILELEKLLKTIK